MNTSDAIEDVKRANEGFYRAFESLDIRKMSQIWLHDKSVVCVHPGWQVKRGWDDIRASWEAIFGNTSYIEFKITDSLVTISEGCAWVVCTENLRSVIGSDQTSTSILATNIFVLRDEAWLMVHHHASPIFTT